MTKFFSLLAVAVLAITTFATGAMAESVQENRIKTMKLIVQNFKPLGAVAKGKAPYTMALVGNAEAMVQLSKGILTHFPEGSADSKSRAKPEIWSDWAGFQKAAAAFEAATPGLVVAAKSGDQAKIGAAVGAVGKTCGGCHKPYRKPKKK
ncbi:MAG: cytochrome c [Alphaproteobacteria bacterium]|jgi:cytochrome c556|nr:cytochrome c [Alphaproteobacteria bacterium]